MRRLVLGALSALMLAVLVVVAPGVTSSAWADCPPDPVNDKGICLSDTVPVPPPPDDPGPGNPGDPGDTGINAGGTVGCPGAPGNECTDANGNVWNAAHNCYAVIQNPQPAPDDPVWAANDITPADGQFYWCMTGPNTGAVWFVESGEAPVIDAEAVARQLVLRAPFEVADLAMAPPFDFHTFIRIENWFWVPEAQWHDVSLTENLGPASVTLTAAPSRLETETGDGAPATSCDDPGRPWRPGMTDAAKTTCSYAYTSLDSPVGSTYTVVGRLYYDVSWTCTGLCSAPAGELGEYAAPDSPANQIDVRQRQTVVTQ